MLQSVCFQDYLNPLSLVVLKITLDIFGPFFVLAPLSLLRTQNAIVLADVPPQHLQQWRDLLGHSAGTSPAGHTCCWGRATCHLRLSDGGVFMLPWIRHRDLAVTSQLHFDREKTRLNTLYSEQK